LNTAVPKCEIASLTKTPLIFLDYCQRFGTKVPRNVPKKSGGAKATEYLEMTFRKRANQVTKAKI
jgi:hypothetical protein